MSVPSSELGPPTPTPASWCVSHSPLGPLGGGDSTRSRVRGWGDPIRMTRKKAWHSVLSTLQFSCHAHTDINTDNFGGLFRTSSLLVGIHYVWSFLFSRLLPVCLPLQKNVRVFFYEDKDKESSRRF